MITLALIIAIALSIALLFVYATRREYRRGLAEGFENGSRSLAEAVERWARTGRLGHLLSGADADAGRKVEEKKGPN